MAFTKKENEKVYTEFEVIKNVGTLSEWKNDVKNTENFKEVNKISWAKRNPVLDIRAWWIDSTGTKRPGKGITFNEDEAHKLYKLLLDEGYDKEPEKVDKESNPPDK